MRSSTLQAAKCWEGFCLVCSVLFQAILGGIVFCCLIALNSQMNPIYIFAFPYFASGTTFNQMKCVKQTKKSSSDFSLTISQLTPSWHKCWPTSTSSIIDPGLAQVKKWPEELQRYAPSKLTLLIFDIWHLTLLIFDICHLTLLIFDIWHLTLLIFDIWHLIFDIQSMENKQKMTGGTPEVRSVKNQ